MTVWSDAWRSKAALLAIVLAALLCTSPPSVVWAEEDEQVAEEPQQEEQQAEEPQQEEQAAEEPQQEEQQAEEPQQEEQQQVEDQPADNPDAGGVADNPDDPADPDAGGVADNPEDPVDPEAGGVADNPEDPADPDAGGVADNPDDPAAPDAGGVADNPEDPVDPDAGGVADNPDDPVDPDAGGVADNPDDPVDPNAPDDMIPPPGGDFADLIPPDEFDPPQDGDPFTVVDNPVPPTADMCTQEVHTCADGSTVSRDANNNCAFAQCPEDQAKVCTAEVKMCPDGTEAITGPDGCQSNGTCLAPPEDVCVNTPELCTPQTLIPPPFICVDCLLIPPTINQINISIENNNSSTTFTEFHLFKDINNFKACLANQSCAAKNGGIAKQKLKSYRKESTSRFAKAKARRKQSIAATAKKRKPVRVNAQCGCGPGTKKSAAIWSAKASDKAIVAQLTAVPAKKPAKCYSVKQIFGQPDVILAQGFVRASLPSIAVDTIRFGFNQAVVRPEEMVNLDRIGRWMELILADHPGEIFAIEGHTDLVGTDTFNLKLSKGRALAVKAALTRFYNIPASALTTAGFGKKYPVIKKSGPEKKNRRIVVRRMTSLVCSKAAAAGVTAAKTTEVAAADEPAVEVASDEATAGATAKKKTKVAAGATGTKADTGKGVELRFDQPIPFGPAPVRGKSIQEMIDTIPYFPPIEGIPEDQWKKKCTSCHKWDKATLCDQGKSYATTRKAVLRHPHPFGGTLKTAIMRWAESGCK